MKINFDTYDISRISRRYTGITDSGAEFSVYAEWTENEGWEVNECEIFWDDKKDATKENEKWICDTLLAYLEEED